MDLQSTDRQVIFPVTNADPAWAAASFLYISLKSSILSFSAQEWRNLTLVDHERLMCSEYVSQKRNEAIDNSQWYNMSLDSIL